MRKTRQLIIITLLLTAGLTACQPTRTPVADKYQHIIVYGFSTEEAALTEEVFPAFQAYWQQLTGQEVTFQGNFAGSEDLTDAIIEGADADVAILSNEQHAVWLQVNDMLESDWHTFPEEGIVTHSPLVIVVRPGNPLGIETWADLAQPGVRLVHPDPRTSGGAQWALLAEYGSVLLSEDGSAQAAQECLQAIWANVVSTPASSREALKEFMFGTGDAMVTYEQDALLAQSRGAAFRVVIPQSTIMSEHIAVIVDGHLKPSERETVEAFVAFLWSETAQRAFTHYYFRAVTDETLNDEVEAFHEVPHAFTVRDLGGWGQAYPEIIHGAWEEQLAQ
jgi:sulfate transport system substrate-binding protein